MVDRLARGKRAAVDPSPPSSPERPAVRARLGPSASTFMASPESAMFSGALSPRPALGPANDAVPRPAAGLPAGQVATEAAASTSSMATTAAPGAARPAQAVVSPTLMRQLQTATQAMATARDLLDHGPANQLFSLLNQRGLQTLAGAVKGKLELEAQSLAGHYTDGASGSAAGKLINAHMARQGIPTVNATAGTVYEAGLIGVNAGFRTGVCTDYSFVCMLAAMKAMLTARQPFELRLVTLGDRHDDDLWRPGLPWNAAHAVALLGSPGERDPRQLVVLDAWVERARALLLSEARYAGGQRPWDVDHPLIAVRFDGARLGASAQDDPGEPASRKAVNLRTWPTIDQLRAVKGRLSLRALQEDLQAGLDAKAAAGDLDAAADIRAFIDELRHGEAGAQRLFAPDARRWKDDSAPLLDMPVYQLERAPGASGAGLYRTASGGTHFDAAEHEHSFAGALGAALSPTSRSQTFGKVAVLEPPPSPDAAVPGSPDADSAR